MYNLQLFAKIIFCLDFLFFFWIPCVRYLFNLVDDIISDVNDDVMSDITDNVIMHDVISDVSHHTAQKTSISHPHPQGQATQIQTAVHRATQVWQQMGTRISAGNLSSITI